MQLVISNNSASSPQTLDLSAFVRVSDGEGLDPAASSFTQRVFQRSLLKAGATLALTQYTERELQFPLRLKSTTSSGCVAISQQIAQIVETPGATVTWQDDGLSAATTWDLVVGTWEVQYRYREAQQHFLPGLLRLFAQPFGRTASPRPYAAASGMGPLLMITPYASVGANSPSQVIGASTQAGVAGYGGVGQGGVPSSGVFYAGSPSLAGDAPALLQVSYTGPLPNTATNMGCTPFAVVSLLPDSTYRVLTPAGFWTGSPISQAGAVASQYMHNTPGGIQTFLVGAPTAKPGWPLVHRLFAIARASVAPATIQSVGGPLVPQTTSATVYPGDWGLYDVGTFTLRPSEGNTGVLNLAANTSGGTGSASLDITALAMLPDTTSWFLNPTTISPSQYGAGGLAQFSLGIGNAAFTNTLLLDDTLSDQFIYQNASQTSAPSPLGAVVSGARITPYSRGLVPRPDPKDGLPIIAILGVGQNYTPTFTTQGGVTAGASWPNSQQLRTMAQVNVLERFRYVSS